MTSNHLSRAAFAACLCTFAAPSAFAHHPGGVGNTGSSGPINTISASTVPAGTSVVSVVYDRIGVDAINDKQLADAAISAAATGDHHAHIHSLDSITASSVNYAYGITSDLMVAVRLPYVMRSNIREGHAHEGESEGEVHVHGNADGVGDISALAQWRFLNNSATGSEAALILGAKAPTGKTRVSDHEGERFDAEFQPGSGSWDGLFGAAFTQHAGRWSFDASLLYTAVSTGTQDTNLGDRLHYGAAVSYRLTPVSSGNRPMFHGAKPHAAGANAHGNFDVESGSPVVDLILEINGEWQQRQSSNGETDANSGGNTVYLSPGLRVSQDKWSAFASIGIPVINDLNGVQAEPDWRLVSGMSFAF